MNSLFPEGQVQSKFPTDYTSIIDRINGIKPLEYGKTRNFVDGAVTFLSPYISRGVISIKQVQDSVLAKGYSPSKIEKFLQELAWREYFQRVWQAKGDAIFQDIKQPQTDVIHYQMVDAIVNANTGIKAIDRAISEFYITGYLHNHVRMYVASIACNIAKAHWLAPSKWMYYHLLDGDPASNTCSWQWVAGAFSSKKYYCNQENINRYTHSHQQNTFLDFHTMQLPNQPVPPSLNSNVSLRLDTNLPITSMPNIDINKPTLIYNTFNLDPLWRKEDDVNRIFLLEPSHFKKFPVSENVLEFVLALAKNISNMQIMVGEANELESIYIKAEKGADNIISKEHPSSLHYIGIKDERDWLYPSVKGYFNSFFAFWKKCEKFLR